MPYISEKIKLSETQDRRRKLTSEKQEEIRELYATGLYSWNQPILYEGRMSMTENEAKEWIEYLGNKNLPYDRSPISRKLACDIAIQAIDKVQQFEAIGTIEEFKALSEKSVAKKSKWKYYRKENIATCNNCSYEHYLGTYHQYATNYCPNCGSKMTET